VATGSPGRMATPGGAGPAADGQGVQTVDVQPGIGTPSS
jgi:hypothetical protein